MFKHVDTVLIGKAIPTSYTTVDALTEGDVALFDETGALITSTTAAADAKEIYVGVAQEKVKVTIDGTVTEKANIKMAPAIKRGMKCNVTTAAHEEPVEDVIVIDLSSATIVAGNRYVLRMIYKDIYEHPGQFSHTYEVFANSDSASDLLTSLAEAINRHPNRRIDATVSTTQLTLTALEKTDNPGIYSVNEYSTVNMEATLYTTRPAALLGNYPEGVAGATITKTPGTPGVGYWKQVRDAEIRNMGYQGHVYIDAYPMIRQASKVVEDAAYNVVTIEWDNMYLSNDNQYIKTTPLVIELYVPSSDIDDSFIVEGLKNFIDGVEEVEEEINDNGGN